MRGLRVEHVAASSVKAGQRIVYRSRPGRTAQHGTVEAVEPVPVCHLRLTVRSDAGTRAQLVCRHDAKVSALVHEPRP